MLKIWEELVLLVTEITRTSWLQEQRIYNALLLEVRGDVAATLKLGHRHGPCLWIRLAGSYVCWNAVTREEPDSDRFCVDLCGIDTAIDLVKTDSIRLGVGRANCASPIGGLIRAAV